MNVVEPCGEHGVLSGGSDRLLALWDVRMCGEGSGGGSGVTNARAERFFPPPVRVFRGHKDSVSAAALFR